MEMPATAEDRQQTATLKQTARPPGHDPSKVRNAASQGGKLPVWIFSGSPTPPPTSIFFHLFPGNMQGIATLMNVALEIGFIKNVKSRLCDRFKSFMQEIRSVNTSTPVTLH